MKCQHCKTRQAIWAVKEGFAVRRGAKVCDAFVCRTWADGGYPARFSRIAK